MVKSQHFTFISKSINTQSKYITFSFHSFYFKNSETLDFIVFEH